MAYEINFYASNRADFSVDFSATDIDTGDDIDFTGATVSIKIGEEGCAPMIAASIGNGITQPTSTILELLITAAQMSALRAGSYRIGGVMGINGADTQLFVGSFVVYEGIAAV